MTIAENVNKIHKEIAETAQQCGRTPDGITLLGVTKTIETERIKQLLNAGVTTLGENRVQEFLPKYEALSILPNPPEWHFIGHLQKNKVKYIIDKVTLIHSVDSIGLAQEINKQAKKIGIVMNILVEVNIAEEFSKFGIAPQQILKFVNHLKDLHNVQLKGLMCVPPFVENAQENRLNFRKMRNLQVDIQGKSLYSTELDILSMGMSGDYLVAIEEGATIVRLGTALFGDRV